MSSIAFPPDDTIGNVRAPRSTTEHGQPPADTPRAERNRRNARKSTGPRTPAGKHRSSQNARTHNLTATTPPPALHSDPTYRQAKQELVDELRPTTPIQQVLVSQLAHLTWQLDQIPRLEHQILTTPLDPNHHAPPTDSFACLPQDPALDTQDHRNLLTTQHLLQNQPTPLTRLWDHHRRLLTRTQSLLRQLLHLQKHHQTRQEDDAALESRLDRNQRAELLNAAEISARDEAFRARNAGDSSAQHCQSAPNPANARHPTPLAQNEPTADPPPPPPNVALAVPPSSPVGEGGGEGREPQSATPRHIPPQKTPPAQNEPTTDDDPLTTNPATLFPCPNPAPSLSSPPGHPSPGGSAMPRILTPLLLFLTFLAPQLRAADDPPPNGKTGAFTLTFTDRSPLSTSAQVCNRMRWPLEAEKAAALDYKLPEESFEVHVPADYTGDKPYGLLVFVNPHPSGRPPQQYLAALDKHHLIYVGANKVGNDRLPLCRMGLSIDAAVNMMTRYNIDKERVYVSGISGGGRVSSMLGVGFPDLFKGGIYCIGCNFYKTVPSTEHKVPGTDKFGAYTRSYDPPPAEFFRAAREKSRHVLITGDFDDNREQTWLYYQGFTRDRFEHVTYYQVPGMGHQSPPAEWYDAALAYLDAPPAASPKVAAGQRPADARTNGAPPPKPAPTAPATQPTDRAAIAASLLTRAKLYVDNHVYEQARERLTWIITKYPETPAAAEARKMLKEVESAK